MRNKEITDRRSSAAFDVAPDDFSLPAISGLTHLNRRSRKRTRWLFIALPLLPIITAFFIWANVQTRQQTLDGALIEAIKRRQTRQAISLLNEGANGNALDIPHQPMSIKTLAAEFLAMLHGKAVSKSRYPSALMLACAFRVNAGVNTYFQCTPADTTLLQALLSHGARANTSAPGRNAYFSTTSDSLTALDTQVMDGETAVVKLLLDYGAQANRSINPPAAPLL